MRCDGIFDIHQIQHLQSDGEWVMSSLDHFGTPIGFSPSCECWQKTGVRGTFARGLALDGVRWLRARHPDYKFRVVLVTTSQITRVVVE